MIDLEPILGEIGAQYSLHPHGLHGLSHWGRVLENGFRIGDATGADRDVVALFAVFHDACRLNDGVDPGHGNRGANLAESYLGSLFDSVLSDEQLVLLQEACRLHTDGLIEADVTIQTCWDADRLDLARVGIWPRPGKLCTDAAREPELIWWASTRARDRYSPEFVGSQWIDWFSSSQEQ